MDDVYEVCQNLHQFCRREVPIRRVEGDGTDNWGIAMTVVWMLLYQMPRKEKIYWIPRNRHQMQNPGSRI